MSEMNMRKVSSRIIAIDGVDKVGKTTLIEYLTERLADHGIRATVIHMLPMGPIRELLLSKDLSPETNETPMTEPNNGEAVTVEISEHARKILAKKQAALLMVEAENVKVDIAKALETGWVILDRSPLSMEVYQGIVPGIENELPYLKHFFGRFPRIDYLYLLTMSKEDYHQRLNALSDTQFGIVTDNIEIDVLRNAEVYLDAYEKALEVYRKENSASRAIVPIAISDTTPTENIAAFIIQNIEEGETFL